MKLPTKSQQADRLGKHFTKCNQTQGLLRTIVAKCQLSLAIGCDTEALTSNIEYLRVSQRQCHAGLRVKVKRSNCLHKKYVDLYIYTYEPPVVNITIISTRSRDAVKIKLADNTRAPCLWSAVFYFLVFSLQ